MAIHPINPRTSRATVIFDSECGFCRSGAAMLARIDGGRNLDFLSLHDPRVAELLPDRGHDDLLLEMHLVEADGRWYAGADSIRAIARRIPLLWGAAAYLHLPGTRPLWRWLYAAVARHRYQIRQRLGCEGDVCAVHARA
jgi:predicted DCC family thiol-disulfide oxidoreductase YuxK